MPFQKFAAYLESFALAERKPFLDSIVSTMGFSPFLSHSPTSVARLD